VTKNKFRIKNYPNIQEDICDLVLQKKIDPVDLAIIEARYCSPLPSMRRVSALLGIDVANVSRRIKRIERLVINEN